MIRNRFLCRGKCIDSGEWIEGIAFPHDNNGQVIILRQHKIDGSLIGNEAYPETVSQYTGFNDDNGNPIFEHDIIQTNTDVWLVSWNKGRFIGIDIQDKRKYLCNSLCSLIDLRNIGEKIIVIGNKFDNPELLSREKMTKQCVKMASDTEELIETLQYLISPNCCETQCDYRHEIKLAIVKLKRNIPIKVTRNNDGEIPCPNCKNILDRKQFRREFCSKCGQALDWNKVI